MNLLSTAIRHYNKKQLAKEVGIHYQTLMKRLDGESQWTLQEVRILKDHFDVSLEEMAEALDQYKLYRSQL